MRDRVRSFIAVRFEGESVARIRAAQERLRGADARVKWVDPGGFHVTLKFLGEVEQERLEAVWASAVEALDGSRAFRVRFRGVGAFPSAERPRVVWAGIAEGAEELAGLAARVEGACEKHGFERERRPFRAHLTLGRARGSAGEPALAAAILEQSEAELGEAYVDRTLLMKSELTPGGAVYEVLEETLLAEGES